MVSLQNVLRGCTSRGSAWPINVPELLEGSELTEQLSWSAQRKAEAGSKHSGSKPFRRFLGRFPFQLRLCHGERG
jgi:hypothetical protein